MLINNPLVSVILPVYGNCKFLRYSVDSILRQTVQDLELIIVYDNIILTEQFIKQNNLEDNRIKLIKGNGNGLSSALNIGIKNSNGKYIARMDSDDISELNRFELQIKYIENNELDACGTYIKFFGSSNYKRIFPVNFNDIVFLLQFGAQIAHPSAMFKSNFFANIKYDESYKQVEDLELWMRAILSGKHLGNVPEYLLKYRTHFDQASKKTRLIQYEISNKLSISYSNNYFGNKYVQRFSQYRFGFNEKLDFSDSLNFMNQFLKESSLINIDKEILKIYILSYLSRTRITNPFKFFVFINLIKKYKINISLSYFYFFYLNNLLPKKISNILTLFLKKIYK